MNNRGALLVGIDHYATTPLNGCVNDARRLLTLLESHENGSPNFQVDILTSDRQQIRRTTLRRKVEKLFSRDGEVALFYFSGHGTENNLGGYLVTQDATQYDEGVSMADILMMANTSPAKERIIIIDSCHSGHLGAVPAIYNGALLQEGVTIIAASRADEAALQQDGSSIFTSLLVNALEGEAADILGQIPLSSVYHYIDRNLGFFDQRPLYKSYVSRFSSLRNINPTLSAADLRQLPILFSERGSLFELNKSFEFTEASYIPENGARFRLLQKFRDAGLVGVSPPNKDLYWAAINNGSCYLTRLGKNYWYLASKRKI